MKIKFDVTPTEFIIIKDILKKYLTKDCKAYVFGSRAKSSSLHGSDLDLALECKEKIDFKKLSKIKIDFEDSRLPYMVDVIDLQATKEYFKNMIEKEMIEFPLGKLERVPELRFKEFSGEWEEKKLGNIATFFNSKRVPLTDRDRVKGIYPYYGASGIIDYVNNYIFDGEYILLGEDGANILMRNSRLVFLANGKFWVNNHAHVFQAIESNYFLCEALERIRYNRYNTGTAQPKLNSEVVKKIQLFLPS
ncbi:MAG: restriction endonuclease subunit S, partial [Campylobacterales bacterium]